jgi:small-conductance mechanosensitive channel
MPAGDLLTASFLGEGDNELVALATVVGAFVVAEIIDRLLLRRAHRLTEAISGEPLSAVADTRLRLVRRLIFTTIIVLGFALALSQFPEVERVATGVLASSAVLGLVVGFAARQTLANAVAGVLLAITQPIRIGDLVTVEDCTGTVEEVRLTYTYLLLDGGVRLIVPNERLASNPLQNHTVLDPRVETEISLWLPLGADADQALAALAEMEDAEARIAEVTFEGIRIAVKAWAPSAGERGGVAARLRKESLRRVREASLSSEDPR